MTMVTLSSELIADLRALLAWVRKPRNEFLGTVIMYCCAFKMEESSLPEMENSLKR